MAAFELNMAQSPIKASQARFTRASPGRNQPPLARSTTIVRAKLEIGAIPVSQMRT